MIRLNLGVCAALLGVVAVGLAAAEGPSGGGPPEGDGGIRRVIVVHFETTRRDDWGCYGGIARTPNVDAVAAKGMRFMNMITVVPKTSPSIATYLTGRFPNRHGVYDVGGKLSEELVTLPEVLRENGFVTGGFTGNLLIWQLRNQTVGFDQGFDVFGGISEHPPRPDDVHQNAFPEKECIQVTEAALKFVDEHQDERFFLWVFYIDPHAPYAPPPPYDSMYLENETLVKESVVLEEKQIHRLAFIPGMVNSREYIARHLGEETFTDLWLGKLLDRVRGLPGKSLIVLTADHGESFTDAGYFGHGENIRYPCVNVPLIIMCEGIVPAGTSDALVCNADLAPTVLDFLGISGDPQGADGRSLLPAVREPSAWPNRMIPIQAYSGKRWRGVRSKKFCLQSLYDPSTGNKIWSRLYDLKRDARETVEAVRYFPDLLQIHVAAEDAWFLHSQKAKQGVDLRNDPEMVERLKALGYIE